MADIDTLKIREIGLRLSQSVVDFTPRSFIHQIHPGKEPRIQVLVGFRGLGKTTALLQLLKQDKSVYFSMDHPYVLGTHLYELGKIFITAGYKTILVDEVHHYQEWKRDCKALYDEFPEATIIISGSAPLAFEPERRYSIIPVDPMSLKEFSGLQGKKIVCPDDTWQDEEKTLQFLAAHNWIYEYLLKYFQGGGFPIYFTYQEKTLDAIYNSIGKSIREDAPFFAHLSGEDTMVMTKMLFSLATASLGEFSINSLTQQLEIKKHKGYELISLLEKMKILRMVRPAGTGPKLVRGDPKLLFYHPNLRSAVCAALKVQPNIGALREELAVFALSARGWVVSTIKGMKKNPDYLIQKGNRTVVVEVGGNSKDKSQLQGFKEETLLLDERKLTTLALF